MRFEIEMSLSIMMPSIWQNVFSCEASVLSLRKQRPGKMARSGAPYLRMMLFCAAEVCVFKSWPLSR